MNPSGEIPRGRAGSFLSIPSLNPPTQAVLYEMILSLHYILEHAMLGQLFSPNNQYNHLFLLL